jgi:hypothetical protein
MNNITDPKSVTALVSAPVAASESSGTPPGTSVTPVAGTSVTPVAASESSVTPVAGSSVTPVAGTTVTPVAASESSGTTVTPVAGSSVTAPVAESESSVTAPVAGANPVATPAPVAEAPTATPPEATTWFAKIKPFLTIENSIISLIIMGICVVLYLVLSIIIKKIFKEGFFGSDDLVDTKEENSKKVKIDEVERQLQDRITNINTNLTSLKKRMDDADIVKDNKPTNLAIAIQNNILAVKEAMMKIIAGLVIQTKMNNGALNVVSKTNAFQKNMTNSINNLINPK